MVTSALFTVVIALFGSSYAGSYGGPPNRNHYHGNAAVAVDSPYKSSGPHGYRHSISAAAIRNVETIGVTKTITPVVTKTTTRLTHSEPALSIGHVQGYTQSAIGSPKIAPVQFNTQYTTYSNPTVGINGPVSYAGPAVSTGYAVAAGPGVGYAAAAPGVGYAAAGPAVGYAAAGPAVGYAAAAPAVGYADAAPVVAAGGYGSYGGYGYAAAPAYAAHGHGHGHSAAYVSPHADYAHQAVSVAEIAPALSIESYGAEAYEAPVAAFTDLQSGQAVYSNGGHYGHDAYKK